MAEVKAMKIVEEVIDVVDTAIDGKDLKKAPENEEGVVRLCCKTQNYHWGKPADSSMVAHLLGVNQDDDKRYAELWMGTHHKGPSSVIIDAASNQTQALSQYIGGELPFLYKVLSVASSLSIQAHPNKTLAEKLHSERPDVYKDDNHKPEMAVAITEFEAMCGFRPCSEIVFFLENVPEFAKMVGVDICKSFIESPQDPQQLKALFTAVMTTKKDVVANTVLSMMKRLQNENIPPFHESEEDAKVDPDADLDAVDGEEFERQLNVNELVHRLQGQYPGDVGILAVFMLNCFRLKPGEGIFLEANLPHAYLSGDCLECMACSDNVVRAGLTPKLRDTPVLCEMLNYDAQSPNVMNGIQIGEYSKQYRGGANINEFRLDATVIDGRNSETLDISKIKGCASEFASIMLVYQGNGKLNGMDICKGDCLLISENVEQIHLENKGDVSLRVARCYAPSDI